MAESKKFVIRCRAIIFHEGKMLTVRHVHADGCHVAFPGGHLEWGEDVKECLHRELVEELGIEPKIGRLFYIRTCALEEDTQSTEFFFEVTNGKDYLQIERLACSHAHELSEIYWVSPDEDIKILPQKIADDFRAGKIHSDEIRYVKGGEGSWI